MGTSLRDWYFYFFLAAAAAAKSLQSCPTLCDPMDGSPPGSPWDSPGKNTGVGCHFLLQCVKVKSESEVTQSCPTLRDPMDCSLPDSSVHGIFQARVLEWVAIAFSTLFLRSVKCLFYLTCSIDTSIAGRTSQSKDATMMSPQNPTENKNLGQCNCVPVLVPRS